MTWSGRATTGRRWRSASLLVIVIACVLAASVPAVRALRVRISPQAAIRNPRTGQPARDSARSFESMTKITNGQVTKAVAESLNRAIANPWFQPEITKSPSNRPITESGNREMLPCRGSNHTGLLLRPLSGSRQDTFQSRRRSSSICATGSLRARDRCGCGEGCIQGPIATFRTRWSEHSAVLNNPRREPRDTHMIERHPGRDDIEARVRRHIAFRVVNEVLRGLGWSALALYAIFFTKFVMQHAADILDAEIRALEAIKAAFDK